MCLRLISPLLHLFPHHYTYLPNSPSTPSAHVWERLLVHCLTAQRGTYTSSEHLTVLLLSLLMYVSRTIPLTSSPYTPSPCLPSSSSSYPPLAIPLTPLPSNLLATPSPINVRQPNNSSYLLSNNSPYPPPNFSSLLFPYHPLSLLMYIIRTLNVHLPLRDLPFAVALRALLGQAP